MKHKTLVVVDSRMQIPEQFEYFCMLLNNQIVNVNFYGTHAKVETENAVIDIVVKSNASRGRRCHHLIYLAEKDEMFYEVFEPIVRPYHTFSV